MLDITDFDSCYAAVHSRDRRFDGRFVTGVLTTGIYCRPSCPARTPKRENVRFFASTAAAQQSGLRACRRCRPELAPDAPGADPAAELASRALRLIDNGEGDEGVTALAAKVHVSPRHLQRILVEAYGAGPAALARMRRVRLARLLVDQTDLPLTRIAYAAGFGSVRQFNEAFRQTFHATPSSIRDASAGIEEGRDDGPGDGTHTITLAVRQPFDHAGVLHWGALHAIPSRDQIQGGTWTRTTSHGVVTMRPSPAGLTLTMALTEPMAGTSATATPEAPGAIAAAFARHRTAMGGLVGAVSLARQVFDLDADIHAVEQALADDPLLRPLIDARPGVRIPGAADPVEGAIRVVLGQQVSARGATTLMGRLAALSPHPGLPDVAWLADAPLEQAIGLTRQRAGAVRALAGALAAGLDLSPAAEPNEATAALQALPGIGPWTAHTIALLVLRHPDAWPTGDLALRRAVAQLTGSHPTPQALDQLAQRWRPWRGYAAMHLWHHHLRHSPPAR
ncbi:MAG TPA: Ada metal-binding domain-containing protein [Euzebya sp.]|nr:Ada metal-binding domain-containing protein [Euzebya sp.]